MLTARTNPAKKASTPRDPGRTRTQLLETAFAEIYRGGFQGTGLDRILERAKVTKGALYHHFGSKEALGYAVIDEVIDRIGREKWVEPLAKPGNAIDKLVRVVQETSLKQEHVEGGCPVNNLAQEMSPLDKGMRQRLARQFASWKNAVARALEEGQVRGEVRSDIDAEEAAEYFMATYEGYMSLAKNAQDPEVLRRGIRTTTKYLESLRAS